MQSRGVLLALALLCAAQAMAGDAAAGPAEIRATLNGLEIALDGDTGALRKLSHPGPGVLLEADGAEAGLVDVAYPIPAFEPLRLAARHGARASVRLSDREVVIALPTLASSRPGMPITGSVSAVVTLRADPDGRSVVASCEIENRSDRPVRQVVFPELRGLLPIAGPDRTILKSCGFGSAPFRELVVPEPDQWYAVNSSTVEHKAGGMFLNVWPSKPDGINGSARVEDVPALSATLKECAALRKRFLRYFTEGVFIGACLMPEVAPSVRLAAYVLPDRALAIVLNQGADGELTFRYDLTPWVPGRSAFAMTACAANGRAGASADVAPAGEVRTGPLKGLELAAFEFVGR